MQSTTSQQNTFSPEVKAKPRFINVSEFPVLIVGQNIGHNRDGTHTGTAWEKNRSAKLLNEAIKGYDNLILTNICNYTVVNHEHLIEGYEDLRDLTKKYTPKKIICLGDYSFQHMKILMTMKFVRAGKAQLVAVYKRHHPSYITRFNKDKKEWIEDIRGIISQKDIV